MAKILVLGAGMVGSAMVRDVAQRHEVVATDFSAAALEALAGVDRVSTQTLDCTDRAAVQAAAREVDAVICAVPGHLGFQALRSLLEVGSKVADISFFPVGIRFEDLRKVRLILNPHPDTGDKRSVSAFCPRWQRCSPSRVRCRSHRGMPACSLGP